MVRFLKINSGASGIANEGVYFAAADIDGVALDASNDAIDITFKKNSETLSLKTTVNKEAEAAEGFIKGISTGKTSIVDICDLGGYILGAEIPAFTIAATDVAITGTALEDFTFTLASATVGCSFTATLTEVEDDTADPLVETNTFTKSGVIATATDTIKFNSDDGAAGYTAANDYTLTVTLSTPNQPASTKVVTNTGSFT